MSGSPGACAPSAVRPGVLVGLGEGGGAADGLLVFLHSSLIKRFILSGAEGKSNHTGFRNGGTGCSRWLQHSWIQDPGDVPNA